MDIMKTVLHIIIYLVALKAIIGFHWPWEVCECCGQHYFKHKPLPNKQINEGA